MNRSSRRPAPEGAAPRQREQQLRQLAEHAGELLLELGPTGQYTFVNPGVRDLLGYGPDEFRALKPDAILHPDDRAETVSTYTRLLMGEVESAESLHRARHKSGEWRWLLDTARAYRDDDGHIRVVIQGRDVTDRHRAEEELARQLETQREIARLSQVFLALASPEISAAIGRELRTAARLARATQVTLVGYGRAAEPLGRWAWCAPGQAPAPPPDEPCDHPWSVQQILAGRTLMTGRGHPLPEEAAAERADQERRGVRASMTLSLRPSRDLMAVLIFDRLEDDDVWSESERVSLRLVGEIFASAMRRRIAEEALRSNEQRFRTIAEQATELVAEFDEEGLYCYVSPSYETLLGASPESLLGQSGDTLIHPDDRGGSRETFLAAFRKNVESHSIHRLRRGDGTWRWFENSGQAYEGLDGESRFVSIGHDITERVETQIALEHQLERERTVAELSRRIMGLRGDALTHEIQRALEQSARLLGAHHAYLASMPSAEDPGALHQWCAPGHPEWRPTRRPWAERKLRDGEVLHFPQVSRMPDEAAAERASAEELGLTSILSVPVRSGELTLGVIGIQSRHERTWSEDEITVLRLIGDLLTAALRRQIAEQALRESQQHLAQSQKLEAVGRLAGGIAHDFNNLLTVILGLSRPILDEFEGDGETKADLQEIHGAAERAAALTRQLLTFSRRHPLEEQLVDLNATLQELRPLLGRMLGEDITLECDLASDLGLVRGDAHQFGQVVVNLAANARDAMPYGGRLHIETSVPPPLPGASATARTLPELRLSVTDSGEGMDPSVVERVFDPFFTTKEPGKGTGLGLSIAYSVTDQAGGRIEVDSTPDKGTRFDVYLPMAEGESMDERELPVAEASPGSGHLLLVEDEPSVRRLVRRILERGGYEVSEAKDGEEALRVARLAESAFDALITDVVMPKMGGGELARSMRALQPSLPILFVSGHPEERGHSIDLDGAQVLRKPFSAETLLMRLARLIDGADHESGAP